MSRRDRDRILDLGHFVTSVTRASRFVSSPFCPIVNIIKPNPRCTRRMKKKKFTQSTMKRGFLKKYYEKQARGKSTASVLAPPTTPTSSNGYWCVIVLGISTQYLHHIYLTNRITIGLSQGISTRVCIDLSTDLHMPPSEMSKFCDIVGRTRFAFRWWPRNPNGPFLLSSEAKGKEASNGLKNWGATLYDFYRVLRSPTNSIKIQIFSGSRLAAKMQEINELDCAQDELAWAASEDEPQELFPYDIGILIREAEIEFEADARRNLAFSEFLGSKLPKSKVASESRKPLLNGFTNSCPAMPTDDAKPNGGLDLPGDNIAGNDKDPALLSITDTIPNVSSEVGTSAAISEPTKFTEPPKSLSNCSSYPFPWPPAPFQFSLPKLEKRIPFHLLPKKLFIHDPDNVLDVGSYKNPSYCHWPNDTIETYSLHLTGAKESIESSLKKAYAEEEAKRAAQHNFLVVQIKDGSQASRPWIVYSHPPRPSPPTEIPEAHLYLSSSSACGKGHHSVVYNAEWELPRDLLVEEPPCKTCLLEKINQYLRKNEVLAYQDLLTALDVQIHYNAKVEFNPDMENSSAEIMQSDVILDIKTKGKDRATISTCSARVESYRKYEGPIILIHGEEEQLVLKGSPGCSHSRRVPPTAKVMVAAKLSFRYDSHLEVEASNYWSFPSYLFEHYNGYNIVPPLAAPAPVGAVVPQFYGYYKPDKWTIHRSPVLLIEHCGTDSFDFYREREDLRVECSSLYYRFHQAGWVHQSVYSRNVARQPGPITAAPKDRKRSDHHGSPTCSLRLIDFGRSRRWDGDEISKDGEVLEVGDNLRVDISSQR
jgi:hypothetical protein